MDSPRIKHALLSLFSELALSISINLNGDSQEMDLLKHLLESGGYVYFRTIDFITFNGDKIKDDVRELALSPRVNVSYLLST